MGEINPPVAVQSARAAFFRELQAMSPQVFEELHGLRNRYEQAVLAAPNLIRRGELSWHLIAEPTLVPDEVTDLVHELHEWGQRYRIAADWVYEGALRLLRGDEPIQLEPFTVAGLFAFPFDLWPRAGESKRSLESRLLREFRNFLRQLPDEPRPLPELERNIRWTIQHRVQNRGFEHIAEEAGVDRRIGDAHSAGTGKNIVHDAVRRLCRFIGLPMGASASPRRARSNRRRRRRSNT